MIEPLELQISLYRGDMIKSDSGLFVGRERKDKGNGLAHQYIADLHPSLPGHDTIDYRMVEQAGRYVATNSDKLFRVPFPQSTFQADAEKNLLFLMNANHSGLIHDLLILLNEHQLKSLEIDIRDTFLHFAEIRSPEGREQCMNRIKLPFVALANYKSLPLTFKDPSTSEGPSK